MATPPERYKKKPRVRSRPRQLGSQRYRHLLDFIERRRRLKLKKRLTELEKRRTLDLSAQVIAVHDDFDNDNDDD